MKSKVAEGHVIRVIGARQNNLKGIDVTIPRGKLTLVTGVSGSGKSSLAFETLYAEGQRRYVESFSTYARQFLERIDRPDVDAIEGLIPAVAIEQKNTIRSARSTLGTLTELNDYLKILFAKRARLHCSECGVEVRPDLPSQVVDNLLQTVEGAKLLLTFPFHLGSGDDARVAVNYLSREGHHRLFWKNEIVDIDSIDVEHKKGPAGGRGPVDVVVDRTVVRAEDRQRLVESVETAYRLGEGLGAIHQMQSGGGFERLDISEDLRHCKKRYEPPREGMFSFSSPLGACTTCNGFGRVIDIDMDRILPDHRLTLANGAIRPWTGKKATRERRWLREFCEAQQIDMHVPWSALPEAHRHLIIHGSEETRRKRQRGIRGWFEWLKTKAYKTHVRVFLSRYRAYRRCGDCGGQRFRHESLLYCLGELTIAEVLGLSVSQARQWLAGLDIDDDDGALESVMAQLTHRLRYLEEVGLGYLTLDRHGRSLSGGEVQRANLTSALGSGLVNTLFVLDEPTIGLHARDTERLSRFILEMTRRENTVVMVEHDPDLLGMADHVVDMGPGPGSAGGEIVYEGPPMGLKDARSSQTLRSLEARGHQRLPSQEDFRARKGITIKGASAQNLKHIDVTIPFDALSVLTGVSGSGKSTLMEEVIHRSILRQRGQPTDSPGAHDAIFGIETLSDVHWVDQASPVASSRANPATYVKAWDGVRTLFARQPLSRQRGYSPGVFSFNAGKGRCPACEGAGFERVEMQFLSDVLLTCQLCEGKRFKEEVLEVRWQGMNIADILELTVDEAMACLPKGSAKRRLQILSSVGLGYLKLGQPLATLSGGEAQRLKIANHLGMAKTQGALFLLDEPTTGLHLADVDRLIMNLEELVAAGNTVLVVEHHLDVIAAADHVLELGPDGGAEGGQLVFSGPPSELTTSQTHTGQHLKRWLDGIRPLEGTPEGLALAEPGKAYGTHANPPAAPGTIEVERARVHNLKDISISLPRNGRTVVSGVSGSGKSSLVFDILFAEGQRRFLDCVSPYARQYITQLAAPDAKRIAGIPPTVAIEQRTTRGGGRSTVANVTEVEPFLRLLFARLGHATDDDDEPLTAVEISQRASQRFGLRELGVLAPVVKARKGYHKPTFSRAARMGLDEVFVDGELCSPTPLPALSRHKLHTIDWVLGWAMSDDVTALAELVERAALLSKGEVRFIVGHGSNPEVFGPFEVTPEDLRHRKRRQFDPRLFSAHTKIGACSRCGGAGVMDDEMESICPECRGERLGPLGRSVSLGGYRFPQLLACTAPELVEALGDIAYDERSTMISEGPVQAISERAEFLEEVGLGYLTLNRPVRSLSGGEAQRIRLAAQLGAPLSGVLYVLDEPTIGLHPSDTELLLEALDRLQARDNGVLMVEHDEATLRTADILVDMGPGAGTEGGEILVQGDLETVLSDPRSITGSCLRGERQDPPSPRCLKDAQHMHLKGVAHHNLRDVAVSIPRERLTVVTGVSGSGKSSLIHDVLAKAVSDSHGAGEWKSISGFEGITRVIRVDEKPIGKNPRSTPATYVGLWTHMRTLFAKLPESRLRGYTAGRFSFNVKGGRCETCAGQGTIRLEMNFLPDAFVTCDSCGGRRYGSQTLHVQYNGLSIHDVLELPIRQALTVFERVPRLRKPLQLLVDVGLGYLKLGQPSPTLSGGEAQRIKLVSHLIERPRTDTVIILDEPSIGLHMADLPRLMRVIHRLVDQGMTVVVIEHNPDVIQHADWVIDLGPGAGPEGGNVLYSGPFKGLLDCEVSRTAPCLRTFAAARI